MISRPLVVATLLGVALVVGCKDDPEPEPTVPDAAESTVDAPPGICGEGTVGYLETCTDTAMCGSCECRSFGHAQICSKTCVGNEDCPAPSGGCSEGYCRP